MRAIVILTQPIPLLHRSFEKLEDLNNLLRGHGQSTRKLVEEGEAIRELQVPQIEIDPSQEQDRKSALARLSIYATYLQQSISFSYRLL